MDKETKDMEEGEKILVGMFMHQFEMERLNVIINARKEIKEFKKYILPMLQILEEDHIKVSSILTNWTTTVELAENRRLPEWTYKRLCRIVNEYPEIFVGEHSTFYWNSPGKYLGGFQITLSKGTCKVKKIITVETKKVETVRYEPDGDCSGLSA